MKSEVKPGLTGAHQNFLPETQVHPGLLSLQLTLNSLLLQRLAAGHFAHAIHAARQKSAQRTFSHLPTISLAENNPCHLLPRSALLGHETAKWRGAFQFT